MFNLHATGVVAVDFIQNLNEILVGSAIAPWEAASYASLGGVYIYMGLYQSFLLGTYVFTYYWGFKNLMQLLTPTGWASESVVFLYLICGLFILIVAILNCFAKQLRRAFILPPL